MNCKKINNKGFSLVEILVAVSIIGIISAIAIPAFQDYRESASLVAGDSTVSNIARAYNNCVVLKSHSDCDTLTDLKIDCSACKEPSTPHSSKFCASYDKKVGNKDFRMCVSVDGSTVTKTIGGGFQVCHETCAGGGCSSTTTVPITGLHRCTQSSDCTAKKTASSGSGPTRKDFTESCKANSSTTAGTCDSSAGTCRS